MKKQRSKNKLAFEKATVVTLNDTQLQQVNGGTFSVNSLWQLDHGFWEIGYNKKPTAQYYHTVTRH